MSDECPTAAANHPAASSEWEEVASLQLCLILVACIVKGCGQQKMAAFGNLRTYYLIGIPAAFFFAFVFHLGGMDTRMVREAMARRSGMLELVRLSHQERRESSRCQSEGSRCASPYLSMSIRQSLKGLWFGIWCGLVAQMLSLLAISECATDWEKEAVKAKDRAFTSSLPQDMTT